jgi:hypothetical protein
MTRQDFGENLFAALKLIGGIAQLRDMRERTPPERIKPRQLEVWQTAEQALFAQLPGLLVTLETADVAEIARRHPWAVRC